MREGNELQHISLLQIPVPFFFEGAPATFIILGSAVPRPIGRQVPLQRVCYWLIGAAPIYRASEAVYASFSHFSMKLFLAAPANARSDSREEESSDASFGVEERTAAQDV